MTKPDVSVHWTDLTAGDVVDGVTSPVRTVVDCARALDFDEALSVADSALRSGSVTVEELDRAGTSLPRTGRTRASRVAREASALAANPFESVLRAIALEVPGLAVRPRGPRPERETRPNAYELQWWSRRYRILTRAAASPAPPTWR